MPHPSLLKSELVRLEPLLRRIYATADPHPEFRIVKLLSRMYRGSGRVVAELEDPLRNHRSEDPRAYLSSSQMNVLAVSVFLALNLGMPTLPLRVAILDDPLQSMDDLNLLGLIDLLKRMRERRQLMLSTHEQRFASLLERKLRPVSESQRTILVQLSGWSSEGPRWLSATSLQMWFRSESRRRSLSVDRRGNLAPHDRMKSVDCHADQRRMRASIDTTSIPMIASTEAR